MTTDIEATDGDGNTAFMIALYKGYIDIAQMLLDNGANVHAKNHEGSTAMTLAVANGNLTAVAWLVKQNNDRYGTE